MKNSHQYGQQNREDHFGLLLAARLDDAAMDLPHDISERLRAGRVRALGKRKISLARLAPSMAVSGTAGTLTAGSENLSWWDRIAAAIPLLALVLGLIIIKVVQDDRRANELAEIDAALLIDDLPPSAYADPGFTQFLKMSSEKNQ